MRVLVLGGTWFVGRAVVLEALSRGFEVTAFNRGHVAPPSERVHTVVGDRESAADLERLAKSGPWDVVVDVSGSVPAVVGMAARALAQMADQFVFVSTVSVYRDWPHRPVDEGSVLWDGDAEEDPGTRSWDPDAYGPLKVGCESAWTREVNSDRLLVLRPHVVLGPGEYVGRLPWWLNRMRRGGQVIAPVPDRSIQPIDARDLASFLIRLAASRVAGIYNVAAPPKCTFADLLRACRSAVGADSTVELVWVDEDWLVRRGVTQWTELPLWRKASAPWSMSTDRAAEVGLTCRPLSETVADTWAWLNHGAIPIPHERADQHGLAPDRELELIAAWHARGHDGQV